MTLRTRLLLALLAVAFVPTAIFAVFTLVQLDRAVDRWYRPGVDLALESALEVTKGSLARLEATALLRAAAWARTWPSAAPPASIETELRASGLDFIQVYRRENGAWILDRQIVPGGVLVANPIDLHDEIAASLASDHVVRSSHGALAGIAETPAGLIVAAGMWTPPDYFERAAHVAHGMTYYRQLGVYVGVQRLVFGVLVGFVVIGLVAVAIVLATRIARETSRPLGDLSEAIGRVASGDLDVRVEPRGARELKSLGASFNSMTERLAEARNALQQAEREAVWRDVARKLAHEFRNMLTPMQLDLQLLECQIDSLAPEQRAKARASLDATLREVGHLDRLAEQFSQYARLPEPNFERLDLDEVARSASAQAPGPIRVLGQAAPVPVRADRLLLGRALHNLLLNAREASPADGEIEIVVATDGERAHLEVLDRGHGLPAAVRERLFEPYVSTKQRGSGLGLSLVRDIARQHGGSVRLENRDGGGARAVLDLPLDRAARNRGAA